MKNPPYIIKASGDKVPFDESKLRLSLLRSGAGAATIENIIQTIEAELYDGISTKDIYRKAFSILKKTRNAAAARYNLKRAIMALGPTGYPFEKYIAEILYSQGYKTHIGVLVKGKCVTHEIDVIAEKDNIHAMVECKFHNEAGHVCDVKVPLYVHSRFQDIEQSEKVRSGAQLRFHQGWLVTNTRFTEDARRYGICAGLQLVSWDYPKGNGLKDLIDKAKLHPITALTTLAQAEKQKLLDKKIVFSRELLEKQNILQEIGIRQPRLAAALEEISQLSQ